MNKKVTIVSPCNKGGGAEIVASNLSHGLHNKNLNINYLLGRKKADKDYMIPIKYLPLEWKLGMFIDKKVGLQNILSYPSTLLLPYYKEIKNSDIIHFHNLHGCYINLLAPLLLYKSNKRIIWTIHDMWPFTGKCAYPLNCNQWKDQCNKCADLEDYPVSYGFDFSNLMHSFKKNIFNKMKIDFICPSLWMKNLIENSYLKDSISNCYHIPTPVNLNHFKPIDKTKARKELNLPDDKIIFLFLAMNLNDERKGFQYFLDTLANLPDKYIEKIHIISVGRTFKDKKVIDILKRFNLTESGYIENPKDLNMWYSSADLLIFTSILDNQPCVIPESLASGTPILAFNSGGVGEEITNNQSGILVENKNSSQLLNEMINLIENPEKLNFLKENTTKDIEKYSLENYINKHIEIYNSDF